MISGKIPGLDATGWTDESAIAFMDAIYDFLQHNKVAYQLPPGLFDGRDIVPARQVRPRRVAEPGRHLHRPGDLLRQRLRGGRAGARAVPGPRPLFSGHPPAQTRRHCRRGVHAHPAARTSPAALEEGRRRDEGSAHAARRRPTSWTSWSFASKGSAAWSCPLPAGAADLEIRGPARRRRRPRQPQRPPRPRPPRPRPADAPSRGHSGRPLDRDRQRRGGRQQHEPRPDRRRTLSAHWIVSRFGRFQQWGTFSIDAEGVCTSVSGVTGQQGRVVIAWVNRDAFTIDLARRLAGDLSPGAGGGGCAEPEVQRGSSDD